MGRIALVVMVLVLGQTARAQPDKPEATRSESTRLFEEGRELAKQGKYAEACARFANSLELDRAPGTALNYGDCLEQLGQLRKAWKMYDAAARDFERDGDPRAKFARERADAVTPRLAIVIVKLADPAIGGLVIKVGTESVAPAAEISELVEPGAIEVVATAPGHEPFTAAVSGIAGAQVIVEVPALRRVVGERGPEPLVGRRDRGWVRLAGIVTGAGGALLLGSVVIGLTARSAYNDADCTTTAMGLVCSEDGVAEVNSAGTRADIATGFAVAGGLGVIGGVVLYLTAPREQLTVVPTARAGTVGLAVRGRF